MAYFKQKTFKGIAPAIGSRLMPDGLAQIAEDVDFEAGDLRPIKYNTQVKTLADANKNSIYLYEAPDGTDYWLQFNAAGLSVVPGPIPNDTTRRIYWTGEAYPKVSNNQKAIAASEPYPNSSYKLGVPQPNESPAVFATGTPNTEQIVQDVSYVYTVVNNDGEEGPPSRPSSVIQLTDDESGNLRIDYSAITTTNYNITTQASDPNGVGSKIRIYRSNSGSTNTAFQFADTIPFGDHGAVGYEWVDTNTAITLGEVLPSATWIGPPDDNTSLYPTGPLQGLIPLASSVLVGFTGKRLCVSERYLPHAWPIQYRITLDRDIIAIASTRGGVAVLTDGKPIFVTGTDPAALSQQTIDFSQSCVNKDSVVDMGDYVIYAGPDGLCALEGPQGRVLTEGQITAADWNESFYPTQIKAFRHENTYVAFYTDGVTHGGWVFDPRGGTSALSTISRSSEVKGGFVDQRDNELYIIDGSNIKKYRGSTNYKTAKYKSKKFVTEKTTSMGWLSVTAEGYPITAKVWADDVLIADYTLDTDSVNGYAFTTTEPAGLSASLHEPVMRLPAVQAQVFEVQIESAFTVNDFCLAQSMAEIQAT